MCTNGTLLGMLVRIEGYQCQKSTLCNKRNNKKNTVLIKIMRYFASARLSIRHKANRTLVYQSRLSTPRWLHECRGI